MILFLTWFIIGFVAFWKTGFDDLAIVVFLYDKVKRDKTRRLKSIDVTVGTLAGTVSALIVSLVLAIFVNQLPDTIRTSITVIAGIVLVLLGFREFWHVYQKLRHKEIHDPKQEGREVEKKIHGSRKSLFLEAFLFYWLTGVDDLIVYSALMLNLAIVTGLTIGIFAGNILCLIGARFMVKKLDMENAIWPNVVGGLLFFVLGIATAFGWLGGV